MPNHPFRAMVIALACLSPTAAVATQAPSPLSGPLIFERPNGGYIALGTERDQPVKVIAQERGTPGAAHWADDGLQVLAWRGDIARVRMAPEGHAATIVNTDGACLTIQAADDIRWQACRGGEVGQVWHLEDNTISASAPWLGYLAFDPGFLGGALHVVRGEPDLVLAPGVLTPGD